MKKQLHSLIALILCLIAFNTHAQTAENLASYEKTKLLFAEQKDPKVFTVLSYNVLEGFRKDSTLMRNFQEWVVKRNPDLVAFQEFNGISKAQLVEMAKAAGYPYTVLQKRAGFPLAIMSKHRITDVVKVIDGMHHGMLYAKIAGYHFIVTHLHPKTYEKRILEVDTLLKYINRVPKGEPLLLMGDFNNMSPLDKADYNNEAKMKLVINSEKNNPDARITKNGEIEYTTIQKLLDAGMIDTWRKFNTVYDKSAPTKLKKHQNYTRIDYIFMNQALAPYAVDATIVKDQLTDTLSDHYPMLLILKKTAQ